MASKLESSVKPIYAYVITGKDPKYQDLKDIPGHSVLITAVNQKAIDEWMKSFRELKAVKYDTTFEELEHNWFVWKTTMNDPRRSLIEPLKGEMVGRVIITAALTANGWATV